MHDTPEEHPRISPEERQYIVDAVKAGTNARNKVSVWEGQRERKKGVEGRRERGGGSGEG